MWFEFEPKISFWLVFWSLETSFFSLLIATQPQIKHDQVSINLFLLCTALKSAHSIDNIL